MAESRKSTIEKNAEQRVGKIQVSGRYHREPKRIDEDYTVDISKGGVLGSGINGDVQIASSKQVSCVDKYAVKAFKLRRLAPDKKTQLEAEVEIFLCMDHPHVARLVDVYATADVLHLVMECMGGGELFDRVIKMKRFSENDAAFSTHQMLLAISYLHSQGIVHRDLKLENFLYDKADSNHLKLIDFGFSKFHDVGTKMNASCGTLSYVAPEVLKRDYTSQCDLWSLGVVVFILLAGYMPFSGKDKDQVNMISKGQYSWKPDKWSKVSSQAKDFVFGLLKVEPTERLTAAGALAHPFIESRMVVEDTHVDGGVIDALRSYAQASKFRRCCMNMMAWSLTNEERTQVRQYFLRMDEDKNGTITLGELRKVMAEQFSIPDDETRRVFEALDSNNDQEIHYSDFLAAMANSRISLHDDLIRSTFKRFDTDNSGYITVDNLKEVLGDSYDGEPVEKLLSEADMLQDGKISYDEFTTYLTNGISDNNKEAASHALGKAIDDKHGKVDLKDTAPPGKSECVMS